MAPASPPPAPIPIAVPPALQSGVRALLRVLSVVAPGTGARVAESLFVRTRRPALRQDEAAFLAEATPSWVQLGVERIAVYRWGSGPAVLLVHGWWSRAGRMVALGQALRAAGHAVVAIDGPGHGKSSGNRGSMPEFAAAVAAVASADGNVTAAVGHSLGGAATVLAMSRGLALARVALIAAPADVRRWTERFRQTFAVPDSLFQRMEANLTRRLGFTWESLEVPRLVSRFTARGLVVHDLLDDEIPFTDASEIVAAWPNAEIMRTTGLGHRQVARDPAVIARVIEFLA